MLDLCADQGVGLRRIAMNSCAKAIAVASHGSQNGELPLLWSLCTTLVELGHTVTVLDGTMEEQPNEPGLMQILDAQHWQHGTRMDNGYWSVLPAARGLQRICQSSSGAAPSLEKLNGLFEIDEIVIVFAHGDLLSKVLINSDVQPLLAVSHIPMSLMTAYRALKQMLTAAQIRPLIATVSTDATLQPVTSHPLPGKALTDCARNFLGCNLRSPLIAKLPEGDTTSPSINRLVTRMLETAMPLDRHLHITPTLCGTQPQFAGSH